MEAGNNFLGLGQVFMGILHLKQPSLDLDWAARRDEWVRILLGESSILLRSYLPVSLDPICQMGLLDFRRTHETGGGHLARIWLIS